MPTDEAACEDTAGRRLAAFESSCSSSLRVRSSVFVHTNRCTRWLKGRPTCFAFGAGWKVEIELVEVKAFAMI